MKKLTTLLSFFLFCNVYLQAQTCSMGTTLIEGYVRDGAGRNIEGVRIIADDGSGFPLIGYSDATGFYQIQAMPPPGISPMSYNISADMTDAHNAYYFSAINQASGSSMIMCGMPTPPTPTADFTVVWKPRSISGSVVGHTASSHISFTPPINTSHPNLSLVGKTVTLKCETYSGSTLISTTTVGTTTTATGGAYSFSNIQNTNPCINGFYKLSLSGLPNFMFEVLPFAFGGFNALHGYHSNLVSSTIPFSPTNVNAEIGLKVLGFSGQYENSAGGLVLPGGFTMNFTGSKDGAKSITTPGSYYGVNVNGFPSVALVGCDPITATPAKPGFTFTPASITQNFSTCATGTDQILFSFNNNFTVTATTPYTISGLVKDLISGNPISGATVNVTIGSFSGTTTTNASGTYTFTGITEVGQFSVGSSKSGYTSSSTYSSGYDGTSTNVNVGDVQLLALPTCTALTLPTQAFAPGNIAVPITVSDFNNIGAISAKINYDSTKLTFNSLSGAPSGMSVNASGGVLTLAWSNITPLSLSNGATLVTLNFTYTGSTSPTNLTFQAAPNTELANGSGTVVCHTPTNGAISQLSYKINGKVFAQTYSGTTVTKNIGNVSLNLTGAATASTTTNTTTYAATPNQNYSFAGLNNGNYTVAVSKTGEWCGTSNPVGGVNATDTQWITDNFLGTRTFNALQTTAADVNNSSGINMTDALQVQLRVAGTISSFAKGDWVFNTNSAVTTLSGADVSEDFETMVVGDVDGSCANAASNAYKHQVAFHTQKSNEIDLDVTLTENADLRAATVFIALPEGTTLKNIQAPLLKDWVYGIENQTLKFVWTDVQKVHLSPNTPLFTLRLSTEKTESLNFEVGAVFSDEKGETLTDLQPKLTEKINTPETDLPTETRINELYPNPFSQNATLSFDLDKTQTVSLRVYNTLGQEVMSLLNNELKTAGTHQIEIDAQHLPNGTYLFRFEAAHYQSTKAFTVLR